MTLPYIDRARIGIYGKASLTAVFQLITMLHTHGCVQQVKVFFSFQGYGAYLTLMLLRSTALIKCAAANSPVIDWKLYGE